ncbi:hypothetical protein D3C84_776850 [compost metagenome]
MRGSLGIDFHYPTVGQHQLRTFVPGVDPLRLAAPQDQPLAVHDVDVVRQNGHRPVDDILRQVVIKFEHARIPGKCRAMGCSPAQAVGANPVLRHKDIRQWVAETLQAVNVTLAPQKIIIKRDPPCHRAPLPYWPPMTTRTPSTSASPCA